MKPVYLLLSHKHTHTACITSTHTRLALFPHSTGRQRASERARQAVREWTCSRDEREKEREKAASHRTPPFLSLAVSRLSFSRFVAREEFFREESTSPACNVTTRHRVQTTGVASRHRERRRQALHQRRESLALPSLSRCCCCCCCWRDARSRSSRLSSLTVSPRVVRVCLRTTAKGVTARERERERVDLHVFVTSVCLSRKTVLLSP